MSNYSISKKDLLRLCDLVSEYCWNYGKNLTMKEKENIINEILNKKGD